MDLLLVDLRDVLGRSQKSGPAKVVNLYIGSFYGHIIDEQKTVTMIDLCICSLRVQRNSRSAECRLGPSTEPLGSCVKPLNSEPRNPGTLSLPLSLRTRNLGNGATWGVAGWF